jgi:hypothetical protein
MSRLRKWWKERKSKRRENLQTLNGDILAEIPKGDLPAEALEW